MAVTRTLLLKRLLSNRFSFHSYDKTLGAIYEEPLWSPTHRELLVCVQYTPWWWWWTMIYEEIVCSHYNFYRVRVDPP